VTANPEVERAPGWPVSVKGVVTIGGRVVLLRNEREEWELPGGRLEVGETPEDCVVREVAEELGLQVVVDGLLDAWVYPVRQDRSVLVLTYGCVSLDDGDPVHSSEHNGVGLFEVGDLESIPLPAGYRRSIERWFAHRPD
jgi:mutator protein MutT